MRIGLIARCRERGLGTLTWEFSRHMQPVKTLVVSRDTVDFRDDERFPGARWTSQAQRHDAKAAIADGLPDDDLDWLLDGIDVLYTAETPYDYRLFDMARSRGIATVLHGMFEYLPYRNTPELPRPDLFLAPSPWCLGEWPAPVVHLPVPVAGDRFPVRHVEAVRRIVHCAGAAARGDRNGTQAVMHAARLVRSRDVELVVRAQIPSMVRPVGRLVREGPSNNYWNVFDGADAALLPRRYGGLSLPLQEATALGLPVLGLQREAHAGYPHAANVRSDLERPLRLPSGDVDRAEVDPRALAAAIDRLGTDDRWAHQLASASRRARESMTWEALRPRYDAVLGELTHALAR